MTLGDAAAGVRLIIWCTECQHQVGPDPAEQITSAMFTGMGLLGIAPKHPCSIGANADSVRKVQQKPLRRMVMVCG